MKAAVLIFFGLLAATAIVTLIILYLRYSSSPAAQWKRRVRAAIGEQEDRLRAARRELSADDRDDQDLRDEFLDRHLRSLAVEDLARYPGIGPVTVSRLRDAGLATVGACGRVRLSSLPGIGPVREADLKDALRKVRREAESRFDAGACREAVAFAQEKHRRKAEHLRRQQAAGAEIRTAEAILALLHDRARIADGITFFGHLFGNEPPGLTDELMAAPLTAPPEPPKPASIPVGKPEGRPAPKPPPVPPLPARPDPTEPKARGDAGRSGGNGSNPPRIGSGTDPTKPPTQPAPPTESAGLPAWIVDSESVFPTVSKAAAPPAPPAPAAARPRPLEVRPAPAEPEAGARATPTILGPIAPPLGPESPAGVALVPASGSAGPGSLEPTKPVEVSPLACLRAVAGLGLAVAKADGRIANAERKQVRIFLERRYATGPGLAGKLDAVMAEVEADLPTLGDALWDVKQKIPSEAWSELYQFAVSVADAAGERNTKEVECLARVAEELGIGIKPPPAHVPAPVVATQPDAPLTEPECRMALEIAPETPLSVDLIRRQHRLLSDRFAPEKFTTHGSDFVKMAADKRDKAERAARHLLAGYNEPVEPPAAPPPPADLRHNPDLDDVFGA